MTFGHFCALDNVCVFVCVETCRNLLQPEWPCLVSVLRHCAKQESTRAWLSGVPCPFSQQTRSSCLVGDGGGEPRQGPQGHLQRGLYPCPEVGLGCSVLLGKVAGPERTQPHPLGWPVGELSGARERLEAEAGEPHTPRGPLESVGGQRPTGPLDLRPLRFVLEPFAFLLLPPRAGTGSHGGGEAGKSSWGPLFTPSHCPESPLGGGGADSTEVDVRVKLVWKVMATGCHSRTGRSWTWQAPGGWSNRSHWRAQLWGQTALSVLTACVTLGKLSKFLWLQFAHLLNGRPRVPTPLGCSEYRKSPPNRAPHLCPERSVRVVRAPQEQVGAVVGSDLRLRATLPPTPGGFHLVPREAVSIATASARHPPRLTPLPLP